MNKFGPDDLYFPVCFRDPIGRSAEEGYIRSLKEGKLDFLEEVEAPLGDVSIATSFGQARSRPGLYNLSAITTVLRRNDGPGECPILRNLVNSFGHTPWLPLAFDLRSCPQLHGEERNTGILSSTFLWYWPAYIRCNIYLCWPPLPTHISKWLVPGIADFELGLRPCTPEQRLLDVEMLSAKRRIDPAPSRST